MILFCWGNKTLTYNGDIIYAKVCVYVKSHIDHVCETLQTINLMVATGGFRYIQSHYLQFRLFEDLINC